MKISNANELDFALKKVSSLKSKISSAQERATDEGTLIGLVGSHQVVLDEILDAVTQYCTPPAAVESDFEFSFSGKKASARATGLTSIANLMEDFQAAIWSSGENILKFTPRVAGTPVAVIRDNCSLTLTYARIGSLHLGLDYIVQDLFPMKELQDDCASFFSEVIEDVEYERVSSLRKKGIQPQFLNRISNISRIISTSFDRGEYTYSRTNQAPRVITPRVGEQAKEISKSLAKRFEEKEIDGRLTLLNFATKRLELATPRQRLSFYYNPTELPDDLIEKLANKRVRVKGTAFFNSSGRIEDFILKKIDSLE